MTSERLTGNDLFVLRKAAKSEHIAFKVAVEAEIAADHEWRGLMKSWQGAGGIRVYSITPAGRALLEGEG